MGSLILVLEGGRLDGWEGYWALTDGVLLADAGYMLAYFLFCLSICLSFVCVSMLVWEGHHHRRRIIGGFFWEKEDHHDEDDAGMITIFRWFVGGKEEG
ncbi:hypothetical protein VTJ04DRAFT_8209 [Mycothermus thermophilus]|uniref:uncharacterized protein n=1 Tax=Humicola insolens TaxID=85995 RepID=UPI0037429A7E